MNCEICGAKLVEDPLRVDVEGSILFACKSCANLGKPIQTHNSELKRGHGSVRTQSGNYHPPSDLPSLDEGNDLVDEYNLILRQARERLAITQEELGRRVNEKPSTIRLIERGSLRPNDSLIRKLEHYLRIDLLMPLNDD